MQEDKALVQKASSGPATLTVIPVTTKLASLELWEPICLKSNASGDEILLLLPEEFSFIEPYAAKNEISQASSEDTVTHLPTSISSCR